MRILILANYSMGLYNFRIELIEELIKQNYEVYFALPEAESDEKVKLLIETGGKHIQTSINRRGINPLEDIKLIKKYISVIKEIDPDVILTYTVKPNIYGSFAASLLKKPVIINITGIGTSLTNTRLKQIVIMMYKFACRKAIKVFFQNRDNLKLFVDNKIVNISKTYLLPGSGVNTSKFSPQEQTVDDGVIRFLFVGRLMKEKGIREYLEAAESITANHSNIEFNLLGPFEEDEFKTYFNNNKNERIKYLGVSSDIRKEISAVNCIVNPSYHEGMSNVLLEAASMEKPIIASNIPGCKEIIDNEKNGYLFDVKSSQSLQERLLQFISLDENKKSEMGKESRKKVQNEFDRNIVISEYMKAINKHV